MTENTRSVAGDLRAFADAIDGKRLDQFASFNIYFHGVVDRAVLAAIVRLMDAPECNESGGTHWVKGNFGSSGKIEVAAFYRPGMLSTVTRTETREVVVEESPSVEELLCEFAEVSE